MEFINHNTELIITLLTMIVSWILGFMAKKCDIYFTIEQKIRRYLTCCMKIYNVPQEKIDEATEQALSMNLSKAAKQAVESAIEKGRLGFEQAMAE